MEMNGEMVVPAPREVVWDALNDAEILKQAIPGAETVDRTSDTEFVATVAAKIGPVKAKFKGQVTLEDIDAPNGYTIKGEGKGGAAGFGKGEAKVALADHEDGTLLTYEASARVGGKLAQIGSRLVDGAAKKIADEFFVNFNAIMSEKSAADSAEAPAAEPEAEASAEAAPAEATSAAPAAAAERAAPSEPENPARAAMEAATQAAQDTKERRRAGPITWGIAIVVAAAVVYLLTRGG